MDMIDMPLSTLTSVKMSDVTGLKTVILKIMISISVKESINVDVTLIFQPSDIVPINLSGLNIAKLSNMMMILFVIWTALPDRPFITGICSCKTEDLMPNAFIQLLEKKLLRKNTLTQDVMMLFVLKIRRVF